jgi:hypothetical protein
MPRYLDLDEVRTLSHRCARGELHTHDSETYDKESGHAESVADAGLDSSAACAHIAYWFAWLVEHDLDSGFVCTESEPLIREHVEVVNQVKAREPGAILAAARLAEELDGTMLSEAGSLFTKAHYDRYCRDLAKVIGQTYGAISVETYARVREMLERDYASGLPGGDGEESGRKA